MTKEQKIIVCGTGRCGTKSLKTLFEDSSYCIASHELKPILPWNFDNEEFEKRLELFKSVKSKYFVEVGPWYLNYLESFIKEIPDIKIIILIRDKHKVIPSYYEKLSNVQQHNFFNHKHTDDSKEHVYEIGFPDYGDVELTEGLIKFYDEYYNKANQLSNKYPNNIFVCDVVMLNSVLGQNQIFKFCNFDSEDRGFKRKIKENVLIEKEK